MPDKFCEYCGAAMQPEDLFCPSCGRKPNNVQAPGEPLSESVYGQEEPAALQPQLSAQSVPYEQPLPHSSFSQEAGQPSVQQTYSYQPPPQNNPFTRFSGEMNAGTPQKRTSGRGMVLGGIIVMIVFAAVLTGVILALHKPDGRTSSMVGTAASLAVMPNSSSDNNADASAVLLDVQNVKKDATLTEIVGEWTGEMQFVRMDGYDTLPADELPSDFKEQIAQAIAEPSPVAIEIEDDGNWSLDVDIIEGMQMGSRDYRDFSNNGDPNIIQALRDGHFEVNIDGTEDGVTMQLTFNGVVSEEDSGLALQGVFMLAVKRGDVNAVMEGHYLVRPAI